RDCGPRRCVRRGRWSRRRWPSPQTLRARRGIPVRPLQHIRGASRHPRNSTCHQHVSPRGRPAASTAAPHRSDRPLPDEPLKVTAMRITVSANGEEHTRDVEPRLLLVHFLRDVLGLTGTHWGCDTSNCGACVVLMDGEPVKSCTVLAVTAEDYEI